MNEERQWRWQIGIEVAKLFVTGLAALSVLLFVHHPNSILSKRKTDEELNRERARLLIDIIQLESESDRARAIEVLRYAYADSDPDLITQVTAVMTLEVVGTEIERFAGLDQVPAAICDEINDTIAAAETGIASLGGMLARDAAAGLGRNALSAERELSQTEARLDTLRTKFTRDCGAAD